MFDSKIIGLPWGELVDRLYHRQEIDDILHDFIKRDLVKAEDYSTVKEKISRIKSTIDAFRMSPQDHDKN
jgi:hypothetical protein